VKKRWILISMAVGLLALMATGGAILAQGNSHSGGPGYAGDLASRVAQILGLDEATVQSALDQAHRDIQDERLESHLDRMVAAERLGEEDADAWLQWFQSRPDAAVRLPGVSLLSGEMLQRRLDRLKQAQVISQEEANEVLAWHEQRPEVPPFLRHGHRGKGYGFQRGPSGWGKGGSDFSHFRGPRGEGKEGGTYRWAPQGFTPSAASPGTFY
jgi:hypothetical protein